MKVLVMAGHSANGYRGSGAVGALNESNETRRLAQKVVSYLKDMGIGADYICHDRPRTSNYLKEQVNLANSKGTYDIMVQIHFNAASASAKGTETYYISDKGKTFANRVNTKLSTLFRNRGVKKGNYYWLKNTNHPAILIETCFCTNNYDAKTYTQNFNKVAQLIAEGLANKTYVAPVTTYKVKITTAVLNIRSGPSTSYGVVGTVKAGEVYTIVESKNGWGRLKSGAGWISLNSKYVKKI